MDEDKIKSDGNSGSARSPFASFNWSWIILSSVMGIGSLFSGLHMGVSAVKEQAVFNGVARYVFSESSGRSEFNFADCPHFYADYLAQLASVSFSPEFQDEFLAAFITGGECEVRFNGVRCSDAIITDSEFVIPKIISNPSNPFNSEIPPTFQCRMVFKGDFKRTKGQMQWANGAFTVRGRMSDVVYLSKVKLRSGAVGHSKNKTLTEWWKSTAELLKCVGYDMPVVVIYFEDCRIDATR